MRHNPVRPRNAQGRGTATAFRVVRGLLPLVLLAGLVSAAPAAADDPSNPPLTLRQQVLQQWKTGGPAVKSAAGQALVGTDEQLRAYLENGQKIAEELDLREAALKLVTDAGPGVREAAQRALDGTPADLAAFMKDGWKAPLAEDERVQAAMITESGGAGLREAGDAAMRGSIDDIRAFLAEGQYKQRDDDARVRVAQLEANGGSATKRAAATALKGTIEEIRDFLTYGQFIAAAQDQEHATITDLAKQTEEAGAAAEKAKKSAIEQASKAKEAARLAKEESAKAAAETKAAQNDAGKAADASRRAAESARRAASAAQAAIASARAANAAAQTAAIAAYNASNAALQASRAATQAWNAAASGKVNERVAADADAKAAAAEKIANLTDALDGVLRATTTALQASLDAIADMNASAGSAAESGQWAAKSGANADEAEAAAASARRHAAEAKRSAAAAQSHANAAAAQAREAATAARSAAGHARRAAEAARHAADYANDAQKAATQAKTNADEALKSAQTADAAVKKAQDVQTAARASEAEEVAARTTALVNQARDDKAQYDATQAEITRLGQQAVKLDADVDTLAQQATQPGAEPATIAATGRKMALTVMQTRGPWSRTAAEAALTGDNTAVVQYVTTGWKKAAEQDEREQVNQLAQTSPHGDVRTAATNALQGDGSQVHTFLTTGQYQAAAPDNRIEAARIAEAGGTGVKEAAKTALEAADPKALAQFILVGQHKARLEDDRVEASRLAEGGTPEIKAAAEAALASPETQLRTFIESGQYRAKRRDQLNAAHIAQVQGIIADASGTAAKAFQDAYYAAQAAANAQGYADEAARHAKTANDYANKAAGYADDAKKSANNAAASASAAAASATSARDAEARAAASAQQATSSATSARANADAAADYAASAHQAAREARQSATNAGASAKDAQDRYDLTVARYMTEQFLKAQQERLRDASDQKRVGLYQLGTAAVTHLGCFFLGMARGICPGVSESTQLDFFHIWLDIGGMFPGYGAIADGTNCLVYTMEGTIDHFTPIGRDGMLRDAALSCIAAIPIAGWGALGLKFGRWADKYGPKAREVFDSLANLLRKTPCGRNSFPAGTLVLMSDGSSRPIEHIKVGDYVWATDVETGTSGSRRVEATIYTPNDRDFTDIEVRENAVATSLTSTDHHPYWVQNRKRWVDAVDLRTGDTLRTPDGATVQIARVSHWTGLEPAHNLTVAGLHTYYVLAGRTPVLVHNSNDLVGCGDQVVLGVNRGQGGDALRDFLNEKEKPASSWYTFNNREGWGNPRNPGDPTSRPLWMEGVEQAAANPSVKIAFSLDHLLDNNMKEFPDGQAAFQFTWARGRALAGKPWETQASDGQQTAWELGVIMRQLTPGSVSGRTWDSVEFYWKGKRVDIDDPFKEFR
ncbi:polymorphic toxin-type HINT domain-containing protein [Streptomyces sp. NPDC006656]|uniref:polymorphic toxin-type HINT domain-containing protein n=1 Tax=Streptomyces sp. NPDC006656 TaxID=3156899 RepID=UPI003451674A